MLYMKGNAASTVRNTIEREAKSRKIHKLRRIAIEAKSVPNRNAFVFDMCFCGLIRDSKTILEGIVFSFK